MMASLAHSKVLKMSDDILTPRSKRDALMAELLGDVGNVHDLIKSLPDELSKSLNVSLENIAASVEEAEKTSVELCEKFDNQKKKMVSEMEKLIKDTFEKQSAISISLLEDKIKNLQIKVSKKEETDKKSKYSIYYLSLTIFISILFFFIALSFILYETNEKINNLNSIIDYQQKHTQSVPKK
jgi:predicted PurR-regulated permease PerM